MDLVNGHNKQRNSSPRGRKITEPINLPEIKDDENIDSVDNTLIEQSAEINSPKAVTRKSNIPQRHNATFSKLSPPKTSTSQTHNGAITDPKRINPKKDNPSNGKKTLPVLPTKNSGTTPRKSSVPQGTVKKTKDGNVPVTVGDILKNSPKHSKDEKLIKNLDGLKQVLFECSSTNFKQKFMEYLETLIILLDNGDNSILQSKIWIEIHKITEDFSKTQDHEASGDSSKLFELQQNVKEYKDDLNILGNNIKTYKTCFEEQFSKLQMDLNDKLESYKYEEFIKINMKMELYQKENKSLQERILQLEAEKRQIIHPIELSNLKNTIMEYIERLNSFDQKLKQSEQLLEQNIIETQLKSKTIEKLTHELDSQNHQLIESSMEIKKLTNDLDMQNRKVTEISLENTKLTQDLDMQTRKFKESSLENKKLTNDLDMQNRKVTEISLENTKLTQDLDMQTREFKESSLENKKIESSYKEELSKLQTTIENLETNSSQMEKKFTELKSQLQSDQNLGQNLLCAQSKISKLLQQLEKLSKENKRSEDLKLHKYANMKTELEKYHRSENALKSQLEKLVEEQFDDRKKIQELQEKIQNGQELMEAQTIMINSLQSSEKNEMAQVNVLYSELQEKNFIINDLNDELHIKKEQTQNLFASLNECQIELMNKKHIIKLLEEAREQYEALRIKQEDKMHQMQEDIGSLKHNMSKQQRSLAPVFVPVPQHCSCQSNEVFYYFRSQRKRKHRDVRN